MELQADDLYVGEVEVSSDGLIHPESAFPKPHGESLIPSNSIRFVRAAWDPKTHSAREIDNPVSSLAMSDHHYHWEDFGSMPEQHHIWFIPQHLPMPDGLHLIEEPCLYGCKELEERCEHRSQRRPLQDGYYNLQISRAMTLQYLNAAIDEWLAKFASVQTLSEWDFQTGPKLFGFESRKIISFPSAFF